ncbi:MAG TPA: hypothetical protein VLN73_09085 [Alphaproteobacteria bacterium]|nr:hypothetical protein [Alphaproteobacteria bacterium]
MGEEITTTDFKPEEFEGFFDALRQETRLAESWSADDRFENDRYVLGFEVEAWLLDHNYFPHSLNEKFLNTLDDPLVVPELSRFNVELNCTPIPIGGDTFTRAEKSLTALWRRCNATAHGLDANMVMIGTLPTIREADLSLENISPLKRYYALNTEVLRQRGGRPITIDISGAERLNLERRDVMMEAATTSFQVHLLVPARLAHHYYNASLMVAGPALASAVNAPFLFNKHLWEETRIPLFEQAIALKSRGGDSKRVPFGSGYLRKHLSECFRENVDEYPVLLPLCFDAPPEDLRHLRLHNGTIWRWVRPLVGFSGHGQPHLRIEFRILPAGPSIIDMIANTAFYVGITHQLVGQRFDEDVALTFEDAEANFYAAARFGLDAPMRWPGVPSVPARELLLDELIPAARAGLAALDIDEEERDRYISVIEQRVRQGRTGAAWQVAGLEARAGDFYRLMAAYCERQRSGIEISQWKD